ncbi:MAG: gamma-glutamyltransferase family protein, partial [Hyphomicrobiaceae bacterium]
MGILEKGGNAFDAAVAAGFALQVLEPHLNGPGGDVPIILNDVRTKRTEVICGQGVAPALATIDAFRSLDLDLVPGTGLLPAVVPGSFDAWMLLLRDHGTMGLAEVLEPAIALAGEGYPVVWRIPVAIDTVKDFFLEHWPTNAAVWLKNGKAPEAGSLHTNPALAATYARIIKESAAAGGNREKRIEAARRAWYKGFVAEAIDKFYSTACLMDVTGRHHTGLLRGEDLARWQATKEAPLALDYGRYRVFKCGPWSQGPAALQQLALLKNFALDGLDPTSPDWIHAVIECAKLAFADREAYYADPDFVDVPVETLLSPSYNEARAKLVGKEASMELRPGTAGGKKHHVDFEAAVRRAAKAKDGGVGEPTTARGIGEPTMSEAHSGHGADELRTSRLGATRGDTCHLDVIDRHGNMVSATPSGGWLQSSP